MRPARHGFTLLEVLCALLLITVALLGLAGTLGPIAALAGDGRARGRIALALESRMDRMRAEVQRSAPACIAPGAGSSRHADGLAETWSAAARPGLIELSVVATMRALSETLYTRLPCP